MRHILYTTIFTLLACLFLQACVNNDEPQPEPIAPVETGRTVLVYMLAKSNGLGSISPNDYDQQDLDEMLDAARSGDITDGRLLVYHSCSNGKTLLKEVTAEGIDTLKIYTSDDLSQSYTRMDEVLNDMKSLAPARDYGLVLWGHGTGWLEESTVDDIGPIQTYAYGWESKQQNSINVTTLARILDGRGFSFIYFDCCHMAGVEVIYQLRNAAPVIAAYCTEILGWGMPYDQNVKHFFSPVPDMVAATKNTFNFYDSQTFSRYRMLAASVFNTSAMDRLAAATRKIYELNTTGLPAGYTPQPYTTTATCYYHDFGSYVRALQSTDELGDEFEAALAEAVLYEDATEKIWGTVPINEHSGFSTFIMNSDAVSTKYNYDRLDWYKDVASILIK